MVVPPVAIYSAIATSKTLAKDLYGIIEDACKSKKDLEKLHKKYAYKKLIFDLLAESLKEISDDLISELAALVARMSGELNGKFTEVKTKLEGYLGIRGPLFTWHFVKEALTQAVEALSDWTDHFWELYVMLPFKLQVKFHERMVSDKFKIESEEPLQQLNAHIRVKKAQLDFDEENIELVLATMAGEPPDYEQQDVRSYRYLKDEIRIPDHIRNDTDQLRSFKLEVARLRAVLGAADPKLTHLPKAVSWYERKVKGDSIPTWFGIAYKFYENMVPVQVSLKEIINMGPPQHSLSDRIRMTQEFLSAMAYVRGLEWVHKAIRASNILLCYGRNDKPAPQKLGYVTLIGFHVARRGSGEVPSWNRDMENSKHWRNQVYCHPDRQAVSMIEEDQRGAIEARRNSGLLSPLDVHAANGTRTESSHTAGSVITSSMPSPDLPYYRYMHDIYSIGVVLLEIGLWRDLTPSDSALRTAEPEARQRILLQIARDELPRAMGEKYTSIVKACLEVDDKGPVVAEVLSSLAQISV